MTNVKSMVFLFLVFTTSAFASECKDPSKLEKAAIEADGNAVLGANSATGSPVQYDWATQDGYDLWTVYLRGNNAGECQSAYFVKTKSNDCTAVVGKPVNVNTLNGNLGLSMEPNCS